MKKSVIRLTFLTRLATFVTIDNTINKGTSKYSALQGLTESETTYLRIKTFALRQLDWLGCVTCTVLKSSQSHFSSMNKMMANNDK